MTKLINKTIKARREELGLSDVFVAATCGLTIDEYVDVEMHADEFETLVRLDDAKLICKALRLDFYDLIGLENDDENLPLSEYAGMLRNQIVSKARERVGMSREQLGDRVGFLEQAIIDMEENPNYLDTWSIDWVMDLAEALKVPPQLLLGKV